MIRMLGALVFALLIGVPAHALVPTNVEPFSIKISPRYPKPYETISITLQSSVLDLLSTEATISADGETLAEGLSVRSATVKMGGLGQETVLEVVVKTSEQTFTKKLTLRPADVALVLEANSTAHPFYQGGRLPVSEGPLRLLAFADFRDSSGALIPTNKLVYSWRVGERVLDTQSGAGKSVLLATAPLRYRDARITVTVTDPTTGVSAEGGITITPSDPVLRVYRNDPLLGIRYEEALFGALTLKGEEETFRAIPYYFDGAPLFSWTINSVEQGTAPDITLRATGGAGSASVNASARDTTAFASASQGLTVRFGDSRPTGIFGF